MKTDAYQAIRAAQLVQEAREHLHEASNLLGKTKITVIEGEVSQNFGEAADTLYEILAEFPTIDIEEADQTAQFMLDDARI